MKKDVKYIRLAYAIIEPETAQPEWNLEGSRVIGTWNRIIGAHPTVSAVKTPIESRIRSPALAVP